jgi:hypothetical protein
LANRLLLGFVAAFLGVLFFHQATIGFFHGMGWAPNPPFRQTPIPPFGVPQLWNQCFWGGLWGILFAWLVDKRPAAMPLVVFAVLFCLALPLVVGAWMVVPLIKGNPMFANGNVPAMWRSLGIYTVWGVGLALFWRGLPLLFKRA